jgi:hypothetical protein
MMLVQRIEFTGTGSIQLDTADPLFAPFFLRYKSDVDYTIVSANRNQYEYSTGEITDGGVMARAYGTITSSDGSTLIDFKAGTHTVVIIPNVPKV